MRNPGVDHFPGMPAPNPWLMVVVLIGSGVTLCWLPSGAGRGRHQGRYAGGRVPPLPDWARAVRAYHAISPRAAGIFMIIGGLVLLGIQIAQA